MSYVPPMAGPAGYASAPIAQDVACRKCGYNLRGLSMEGRCPECGTAVGYSLQGDLLRFMNPDWVDLLRRGVSMIIWGVAVIVFAVIGAIAVGFGTQDAALTMVFTLVGVLVGWVLMLVGWILLTSPDPSGLGEDQYGTARKLIRVALAVGVFQQLLGLTALLNLDPGLSMMIDVVSLAAGIFAVVGIFAQLTYLEKLALRIPDMALSQRAHFLRYALGISYCVSIVLGAIMQLAGGRQAAARAGGAMAPLGCIAGIAGLAMLVFGIMYLLMLEKMGRKFKEQAAAARSTWAAQAFAQSAQA